MAHRKILGYGEYAGWERMSVADMHQRYGIASGYATAADLLSAFVLLDPQFGPGDEVGNVILENFTPFEKPVPLKSVKLNDLSVPFAYIPGEDPISYYMGGLRSGATPVSFVLRDPEAARRAAAKRKVRVGQPAFRRLLIDTYGAVCAFTGPQLEETLQAAHIQPYVDAESNHVCNGLLLRADMHVLFDLGLVCLTDNLCIRISNKLKGRAPAVEQLDDVAANLKNHSGIKSAAEAVAFHRSAVFES